MVIAARTEAPILDEMALLDELTEEASRWNDAGLTPDDLAD
jgi:hypothetical protein